MEEIKPRRKGFGKLFKRFKKRGDNWKPATEVTVEGERVENLRGLGTEGGRDRIAFRREMNERFGLNLFPFELDDQLVHGNGVGEALQAPRVPVAPVSHLGRHLAAPPPTVRAPSAVQRHLPVKQRQEDLIVKIMMGLLFLPQFLMISFVLAMIFGFI
ncbi:hypothetical protein T439DRAFT_34233 [Meredithblackwellia eburnea MCA 4105]